MSKEKITWIIFVCFVLLNVPLFILGVMDIFDSWPLYQIPLFQIAWLYGLADYIGFDVVGKSNEVAALPNLLGLVFVISGSCVSLLVNYLVAGYVAKLIRINS